MNNEQRIQHRILLTSLLTVIALSMQAQSVPAVPRLIVGLTIDQLRTDYVEAFSALYGERGFKRLMREGRIYTNAEYDFTGVDRSSSVATIYSGASPSLSGIPANQWMDRNTLRLITPVDDSRFMGIYSSESTSAERLLVSNLTDELMIASQGKALTYSIAPTRDMAVLAAGHAACGAFWINDETGKWSGSTYYGTFPTWVANYNDRQGLDFRIAHMAWEPYAPTTAYRYLPNLEGQTTFKHVFDAERKAKYRRLKTSPYANDEVNKLVSNCLQTTYIGQDEVPDLLTLGYYAGNYDHKSPAEMPMEMQDVYVRLDNSLGELLDMIDRKVGLQNTLIFITSTGCTDAEPLDPARYRVPTGEFHMKRCAALLNMYLAAIYGEGQYVETYHDHEIYLNHKFLEKKQLALDEVMDKCTSFLVEFSGVKEVYSSHGLRLGSWTPHTERLRNRYNAATAGDLWIKVLPGWRVVRDDVSPSQVERYGYVSAPLIFCGWKVKGETIHTPVDMGRVATTVAHCIRIRAPNAAEKSPLTDILK
jgi:hypothetical protein